MAAVPPNLSRFVIPAEILKAGEDQVVPVAGDFKTVIDRRRKRRRLDTDLVFFRVATQSAYRRPKGSVHPIYERA